MNDLAFDPAAWVRQWRGLGGDIDPDGLRWPFPIWEVDSLRTGNEAMRAMLLALTAEQGDVLRTWARKLPESGNA